MKDRRLSDEQSIYEAGIVGGGPAGLSAALVLGRCRRKVIVIDAGQPRNAASHAINGFLGHDGIAPQSLLEIGRREIARYGVKLVADSVVEAQSVPLDARCPPTCFCLKTKAGQSVLCRKVLFATGMCDALPDFPGVKECYGISVHHCPYCDGWEHRDKRIVVYGHPVTKSIGLALALKRWSSHVTVLTDGRPVGNEEVERLAKHDIDCVRETIVRFVHYGNKVAGVELVGREVLPAEALFFETHQRPSCELPRSLGVECDDNFSGRNNRKQKTNVAGLFVAGDADGDVQFAIVAAAEGATAAVAINRELQEEDQA